MRMRRPFIRIRPEVVLLRKASARVHDVRTGLFACILSNRTKVCLPAGPNRRLDKKSRTLMGSNVAVPVSRRPPSLVANLKRPE
jgi:hypothetical protein